MLCNNIYSVALCKTCEKKKINESNNNETINNDNINDYDSIETDISGSLSETNTDIDSNVEDFFYLY
tara:strand:- start:3181 stop:3381 length:201 start_codon:yes stop_codon:yes gene_type:complete